MNNPIRRGWRRCPNSRKAHYFNASQRSLCGGYGLLSIQLEWDEFEDFNHESEDNCARCKKLRAELATAEAGVVVPD